MKFVGELFYPLPRLFIIVNNSFIFYKVIHTFVLNPYDEIEMPSKNFIFVIDVNFAIIICKLWYYVAIMSTRKS